MTPSPIKRRPMSALFSSFTIRGLTTSNRVAVSPMCQYVAENGRANDWHLIHLGGLASSGEGLLFIEGGELISIANGGWETDAPAAVPHKAGERAPHALDAAGMRRVRKAFADAAMRASRLGLDGLEI